MTGYTQCQHSGNNTGGKKHFKNSCRLEQKIRGRKMNMTAEEKEHKVKLKVTEVIAELCETETNILQSET